MKKILCIFSLIAFFLSQGEAGAMPARVTKIVDGDTLHVMIGDKREKIRLYGVDAPEKNQEHGKEATDFLLNLLGRAVDIEIVSKDKYKRIVAFVSVDDISVQEALLDAGLSWVYARYCKIAICERWREIEDGAKEHGRGLWQENQPMPPWEWRRK